MRRVLLLGLTALLLPPAARSESPSLAPVFQDSMVLQRAVPVPVWGTARAGTAVTVTFVEQRKATKADEKGKWRVTLDALAADAEPRDLKVVAGEDTLVVRDVLVGEVWVAAGQSNMEWPLANEAHAKAELPRAELPKVRLLNLAYAGQSYFAKPFGQDVLKRLTPDGFYGKAATGFEIAGADGMFRPADVEIRKDTVTLTSRLVTEPVSARYGWQPFSTGNLTNGASLPASTFLLTLPRK